jgi:uncharacterized membrane protein YphA (DoxX/SURF4 family)
MESYKYSNSILTANRILLGLVMLIPGLAKLFVMGPDAITQMLVGLGFPIAGFFAWLLIILEIAAGIAIIANWNLKYIVAIPIVILLIAAFTAHLSNIANIIVHIALASNYLLIVRGKA